MVLNSQTDHEGKISTLYDSTNVIASKYDPASKKLVVIFGNGRHYLYEQVTPKTFEVFQQSPSKGSAIHSIIKTHHTVSLGNIDITHIKEDINRIKNLKK